MILIAIVIHIKDLYYYCNNVYQRLELR